MHTLCQVGRRIQFDCSEALSTDAVRDDRANRTRTDWQDRDNICAIANWSVFFLRRAFANEAAANARAHRCYSLRIATGGRRELRLKDGKRISPLTFQPGRCAVSHRGQIILPERCGELEHISAHRLRPHTTTGLLQDVARSAIPRTITRHSHESLS